MIKVKLCGIKTAEDTEIVNCFKPDYAGLIFYPKSKRYVTDTEAGKLRNELDKNIPLVGVFVDEDKKHIADLYNSGIIQVIQLHGNEDAQYVNELRKLLPDKNEVSMDTLNDFGNRVPIIKAVRVRDGSEIEPAEKMDCDMLLLDNYDPNLAGGTGKRFDLSLIPKITKPYFVAGGINADNVTEVLTQSAPYAIDVSSSIETEGHKDWKKVEKLMLVMEQYR
ncbi:MAG: phosphoribosylanthranilate isomerase [Butyrivibrio sp.]|nr:phosphoribosylanthranilate isomerase [Butyrivibrio sp.]